MVVKIVLVLVVLCSVLVLGTTTQFGYAPGENVTSIQDMVNHSYGKILKLGNNFKRLAGNAERNGNDFITSLNNTVRGSAAITKVLNEISAKTNVTNVTPGGPDVSSCLTDEIKSGMDLVNQAKQGADACVANVSAALQPYYQRLKDLVAVSQVKLEGANVNVSDCVKANRDNYDGMSSCLNIVGGQVFEGRDILMALILSEMANFKHNKVGYTDSFNACAQKLDDEIVEQGVALLNKIEKCIKDKQDGSSS